MSPSAQAATDEQLIQACAGGDREAFAVLVARYHRALLRYLMTAAGSRDDAEDLLQETFLAAWKNAGGFRAEASVKTWLYVLARNLAFQSRRHADRMPEADTPIEELGLAAGWGSASPETAAIQSQQRERLAKALASLPGPDREILLLRDVEGLPGEQTAVILGLALPAMKTRLHRARLRLMATIRKEELP